MNSLTTDNTLCCSYCGHNLSDAVNVTYINGQPICAMCQARMVGLRKGQRNPFPPRAPSPPYQPKPNPWVGEPPVKVRVWVSDPNADPLIRTIGTDGDTNAFDDYLVYSGALDRMLADAMNEPPTEDWEKELAGL